MCVCSQSSVSMGWIHLDIELVSDQNYVETISQSVHVNEVMSTHYPRHEKYSSDKEKYQGSCKGEMQVLYCFLRGPSAFPG